MTRRGNFNFEAAALARKGGLELRLQSARERLARDRPANGGLQDRRSIEQLVALYVDMIAVIDGHLATRSESPRVEPTLSESPRPHSFQQKDGG